MPTYGQYDVPKSDVMVNLGVGQPDNRKLKNYLIIHMLHFFRILHTIWDFIIKKPVKLGKMMI